jgi:hypothetical protein
MDDSNRQRWWPENPQPAKKYKKIHVQIMPPDYPAIIRLVSSDHNQSIQLPGQTHSEDKQASMINKN